MDWQKVFRNSFPVLLVILQNSHKKELVTTLLNNFVIYTLSNVVHNILLSNIRLSQQEKNKLKSFRGSLFDLVKKNKSLQFKANLLIKNTSLLKLLVSLSVQILSELLKHDG